MAQLTQGGLEWEQTLFDLIPRWAQYPYLTAIENICRRLLKIPSDSPCTITFHASGLFNKLYIIKSDKNPGRHIMRVSLPVYPQHKTRSEVATLRWLRENTSIPVPEVYAFDDSNSNEIGFEYILMEFMEGKPAHERWWTMEMEEKIGLTKQVAGFQAELLKTKFRGIGSLMNEEEKRLGLFVSPRFFMGDCIGYDVERGPFWCSRDWLSAELRVIILQQMGVLRKTEDEDEREDAEEILGVAKKLLGLVDRIFDGMEEEEESKVTASYHHDLHLNNILVDEKGEITAVLDWECVSAVPIWMATKVPKFLEEGMREEEPQRDDYADEPCEDGGDKKNELYYVHRMEWEATQLRKVYDDRLKELWSGWCCEESRVKVEFLEAVQQCDGIWVKRVGRWADALSRGESVRLEDV
ncbi:kinase-like domain-containing protein [Podospora fimiseda]|uniref:Kinase-like domain-containing protein n=1 Tax=Podospora fimiseda TaxID=252190 RepID=A0AAN7BF86_9PEZI|nr:kinase-like domain-containing protein [Podospora fimiseda]